MFPDTNRVRATEVPETDGTVLWWKLRPFSEVCHWQRVLKTNAWKRREKKRDKNRRRTMLWWNQEIKKPNPTESCKPLWRKSIQVTAKNRHPWCSYPQVNMSVDHRFAVNVQSSQKRLFTPMGTKGLGLKAAAFTFLSMHLPLVRGLKTTSERWALVHKLGGLINSFFRSILWQIPSALVCPLTFKPHQPGKISHWLDWYFRLLQIFKWSQIWKIKGEYVVYIFSMVLSCTGTVKTNSLMSSIVMFQEIF